ncbi:MAG: sigma-54-dependent transcriptional regulator [Akkermansiaceae bacterium]
MNALVIDPDEDSRNTILRALKAQPFRHVGVVGGFETIRSDLSDRPFAVAFVSLDPYDDVPTDVFDPLFEEEPIIRIVAYARRAEIQDAVEAMRIGAIDFVSLPVSDSRLSTVCSRIQAMLKREERTQMLEFEQQANNVMLDFTSDDAVMKEVLDVAVRVAPTDATTLLLGESGTGKSVLASAIHENSSRSDMKITTVHCPSLSENLLESTLFGHVKGSFTGAVKDQWGCVASGDGGTLFLDEIGELPLDIQPKLLQLLQEKSYRRIGETKLRHADVRIISATNRDLEKEVAEGTFREDLYYRLNVITMHVPSLRERPMDLKRISESMLGHLARTMGKSVANFDASAQFAIQNHSWPGNIRELKNTIERAVILSSSDVITAKDLRLHDEDEQEGTKLIMEGKPTLAELGERYIEQTIRETRSLGEAAKILGVDPSTLYRKRKKMQCDSK